MIGEATEKPWHKSELLGHIDGERDTQVDFIAVKAFIPACKVVRTTTVRTLWAQTQFAAITGLVTCNISTEARGTASL